MNTATDPRTPGALALTCALLLASPAAAQPLNPGFDVGLDGWSVASSGDAASPGSVRAIDGAAELREGDAFQVRLSQTFAIDAPPEALSFTVALTPGFDGSRRGLADAFEVTLLDGAGRPLVAPWKLGASAFLNIQEGGAVHAGATTTWGAGGRVTVDLRGLPAGLADATLLFSLVGGDRDTGSAVRVDDVELTVARDDTPLDRLRDQTTSLCLQVQQTMSVHAPGDLAHDSGDAPKAVEVCQKGVACLDSDPAQYGCALLALVGTHKLTLNVERDSGDDHEALRAAIVGQASALLTHLQATWDATHPPSAQRGAEALARVSGAGTAAMAQAEEAFFWLDDARRPFARVTAEGDTCQVLTTLLDELGGYAATPTHPAADGVAAAMAPLEEGRALLCDAGLGPQAPCYDRNFLVGLSRLMDAASALKDLREGAEVGDDGTLVWTRNWQLGVSRVAQYWLTEALGNLQRWIDFGGVLPGHRPVVDAANASWGDAEALLDAGDLDDFIARFTDPAAKCLMHDAYEYVTDWWRDAADASCPGGAVAYPAACFDDAGQNLWPVHQVRVAE